MRKSGILMPITSLGSPYGIGCFSKEAYEFADFLKESGQSLWQILPMGHTGFGDSPYQSFSAFAGNPYMIDLCTLEKDGLLSKLECDSADLGADAQSIDYAKQYQNRYPLLRKAYKRSRIDSLEEYRAFVKDNTFWLDDYTLFMSLKEHFGGKMWSRWNEDIKTGKEKGKYRELLADEIGFWSFVQFEFFRQWKKLKEYINKNGIEIVGDIPIYVSADSSDAWANPELFALDSKLNPTYVAGCPPDGFSAKGQLWGNPVYNWQNHKKDGYSWWISRIKHSFEMYDLLRIDHFRGFDKYYAIPAKNEDATEGSWEAGPGIELFDAIESKLGKCRIIAEDLGFITDSVKKLLHDTGFAGIKVLEFAFDTRDSGVSVDYLPHNYPANCVAYTGTHDNEPVSSWFMSLNDKSRLGVRSYLCNMHTPNEKMYLPLICETMKSPADTVILPMWDILGLGNESRINTPGTSQGNWTWRLDSNLITKEVSAFLKQISHMYGRC